MWLPSLEQRPEAAAPADHVGVGGVLHKHVQGLRGGGDEGEGEGGARMSVRVRPAGGQAAAAATTTPRAHIVGCPARALGGKGAAEEHPPLKSLSLKPGCR